MKILFLFIGLMVFTINLFGCNTSPATPSPAAAVPSPNNSNVLTIRELISLSPKLKPGDIVMVSGVIKRNGVFVEYMEIIDGWEVALEWNGMDLVGTRGLAGISPGTKVIVRGKFDSVFVNPKTGYKGINLENCVLVLRDS